MTGLSTATSEKRKGILKDALNLLVYPKLEKIAKEKASLLLKDIEKNKILIENLGDPVKDLDKLVSQLSNIDNQLIIKQEELTKINFEVKKQNDAILQLTQNHSLLESKFASFLIQETSAISDKNKLEISVKEYTSKCNNVIKSAKEIIAEVNILKSNQDKLKSINFDQTALLIEQLEKNKEKIAQFNQIIKTSILKYEELKVPLPSGSICEKCRKPMSDSERDICQKHIDQDIVLLQKEIQESKKMVITLNAEINNYQQTINGLNSSKQNLENINNLLINKNKEYQDRNDTHSEYRKLLDKFKKNLEEKNKELELLQIELKKSSLEEANNLNKLILLEKQKVIDLNAKINLLNKEIAHFSSNKAVIQHNIDQKSKDKDKQEKLVIAVKETEIKYSKFPSVVQGFSSIGIPNFIIQDVLDDLQLESNNLLTLLKPGLQLSFFVEKTDGDGDQVDTLDIKYYLNGKERYYEQLSGAMRLAVAFSLKLGLSFVLQNRLGTEIKFLLLDEIDQSLDKASVDAFADIVKFFQKDFTILVITHNDRLKDKFSHAILVEQNTNMISKAKVVSHW